MLIERRLGNTRRLGKLTHEFARPMAGTGEQEKLRPSSAIRKEVSGGRPDCHLHADAIPHIDGDEHADGHCHRHSDRGSGSDVYADLKPTPHADLLADATGIG